MLSMLQKTSISHKRFSTQHNTQYKTYSFYQSDFLTSHPITMRQAEEKRISHLSLKIMLSHSNKPKKLISESVKILKNLLRRQISFSFKKWMNLFKRNSRKIYTKKKKKRKFLINSIRIVTNFKRRRRLLWTLNKWARKRQ